MGEGWPPDVGGGLPGYEVEIGVPEGGVLEGGVSETGLPVLEEVVIEVVVLLPPPGQEAGQWPHVSWQKLPLIIQTSWHLP